MVLLREHGAWWGMWSEDPWAGIVNHVALGEIPDFQGASVCRKCQEGFLEEVMDVIEIGRVTKEGRHPVRGVPSPPSSGLSPLDAFIQVSQL